MKTASTAMQAHLQANLTTLARLYKIVRKDGTVLTYTDHDQDISYPVGSIPLEQYDHVQVSGVVSSIQSNTITVPAGKGLAVFVLMFNGGSTMSVTSMTDPSGNTYGLVPNCKVTAPFFGTFYTEGWFGKINAGFTGKITVNFNTTTTFNGAQIYILQYDTGIAPVADNGGGASANTTTVTATATMSGAPDLLVGFTASENPNHSTWADLTDHPSSIGGYILLGDRVETTSGAKSITANNPNSYQEIVLFMGITLGAGAGPLRYEAAVGFSPSAIENKSDLSVDNQEVTAFIDSNTIKENELRYGIWDSADVEIRVVNWADLSMGEIKMRKGQLGNIHMKNGVMTVELLGLTNKLQILQGRSYGSPCDAELGDNRCKATVPVEHSSVSAAVDSHHLTPAGGLSGAAGFYTNVTSGTFIVTNPNEQNETTGATFNGFIAASGTYFNLHRVDKGDGNTAVYTWVFAGTGTTPPSTGQSIAISGFSSANNGTFTIKWVQASSDTVWNAGYYDDGFITFTSGINSGLSFQIDQWDGVTLSFKNALFSAPTPGDTFDISPGCAHNVQDCHNKFNNLPNHRGFPTIPGQDSILQYPDAKG